MHTEKTNAMRALDRAGVKYDSLSYLPEGKEVAPEDAPSGVEAARIMGLAPEGVFKTLVTRGKSLSNYVFVIPVARELDLKKAARAVGEKSVEMVKSKELFPLTGYVHGGCSPLGMKKAFVTVFDESARTRDDVVFSAGKIGRQVRVSPADLHKALRFTFADLVAD